MTYENEKKTKNEKTKIRGKTKMYIYYLILQIIFI